jgi:hypothetical protein
VNVPGFIIGYFKNAAAIQIYKIKMNLNLNKQIIKPYPLRGKEFPGLHFSTKSYPLRGIEGEKMDMVLQIKILKDFFCS